MHLLHSSIADVAIVQTQQEDMLSPTDNDTDDDEPTKGKQKMAYYTDVHAKGDLTTRALATLGQWFEAAAENRAKRRVYRTTLNELQQLSRRELADLGLHASELKRVAYEAAYMN